MAWEGIVNGVVNPASVLGVPAANIFSVNGVQTSATAPVITIDDIVEDSAGTCEYPAAGTCVAQSEFSVVTSGGSGTKTYLWSTDVGSIVAGQGTASCTVEIDSGTDITLFNVTCQVTDDSGMDSRQEQFSQSRSEEASGPTVYVLDTFTAVDGTQIEDRAPDTDTVGGGWQAPTSQTSGYGITGNRCSRTGSFANSNGSVIDSGQSDCVIRCDIETPGSGFVGVTFRNTSTGSNGTWQVRITSNQIQIRENTSVRGTATIVAQSGELVVTISGTNITAEFDGQTASYGNAAAGQTDTQHGPLATTATTFVDNFQVEALP